MRRCLLPPGDSQAVSEDTQCRPCPPATQSGLIHPQRPPRLGQSWRGQVPGGSLPSFPQGALGRWVSPRPCAWPRRPKARLALDRGRPRPSTGQSTGTATLEQAFPQKPGRAGSTRKAFRGSFMQDPAAGGPGLHHRPPASLTGQLRPLVGLEGPGFGGDDQSARSQPAPRARPGFRGGGGGARPRDALGRGDRAAEDVSRLPAAT